jgi:hypothetical protein
LSARSKAPSAVAVPVASVAACTSSPQQQQHAVVVVLLLVVEPRGDTAA